MNQEEKHLREEVLNEYAGKDKVERAGDGRMTAVS